MKDRDLKKLNRQDLLKMLLEVEKENRLLTEELECTKQQLAERTIKISEAGTLAEAALSINGVLEAAQRASDDYQNGVRDLCEQWEKESKKLAEERIERSRRMLEETELVCREMEQASRAILERAIESKECASVDDWEEVYAMKEAFLNKHPRLAGSTKRRGST